jgi:hypothetical protein
MGRSTIIVCNLSSARIVLLFLGPPTASQQLLSSLLTSSTLGKCIMIESYKIFRVDPRDDLGHDLGSHLGDALSLAAPWAPSYLDPPTLLHDLCMYRNNEDVPANLGPGLDLEPQALPPMSSGSIISRSKGPVPQPAPYRNGSGLHNNSLDYNAADITDPRRNQPLPPNRRPSICSYMMLISVAGDNHVQTLLEICLNIILK